MAGSSLGLGVETEVFSRIMSGSCQGFCCCVRIDCTGIEFRQGGVGQEALDSVESDVGGVIGGGRWGVPSGFSVIVLVI